MRAHADPLRVASLADLPGVLPAGETMTPGQYAIGAIILACIVGCLVLPKAAGLLAGVAIAAAVLGAAFFPLPPGGGGDDG